MKTIKSLLLATAAVSSMSASTAFAQSIVAPVLSGTDLKGAGASSIENVVVQAFNCISGPTNDQQLGRGAPTNTAGTVGGGGTLITVPAGVFTPTSPSAANPAFNCAVDSVQPNFKARYVSTGSGFGRTIWSKFSNQFTSNTGNSASTQNSNPFEVTGDPTSVWTNVQYAFSDGPITASTLTDYTNNANNTTNKTGPAIQIPFYVLPVALAYSAQYGLAPDGITALNFTAPGGIKLKTAQYCAIFNGAITNFKDISTALKSPADSNTRWNADGVPIRLIGRSDSSGTTDIFTRHLTAVCGTTGNRFTGNSQSLPGTAVGTGVYTTTYDANGIPTGTTFVGAETAGKFALAKGSEGVAAVLSLTPDAPTGNADGTLLNGRLGYISADFLSLPSLPVLAAAQLTQVGSETVFKAPTPANASAAIATIVPPQSTSNGTYNASDVRKNSVTMLPVKRANPLDWTDVLYSRADLSGGFTGRSLAAPSAGYPITGTTQLLTYTCFASDANRYAISEFIYANVKKVNKNSTNGAVSTSLFAGTAANLLGLTSKAGLAPMPTAWQKATLETFGQKTTTAGGALGNLNLWIQTKQPTTSLTGITSNPACTSGTGA